MFSISPSPFSCFTRLCCSCTPTLTSPFCPSSCRTFPSYKRRTCATHLHRGVWLPGQVSKHIGPNNLFLAIDTTVFSALFGPGVASGRWEGQATHEAENDKRRRYYGLVDGCKCLFVMAFEVAGRWRHEAVTFLRSFWYKFLSVPRVLRRPTKLLFFQAGQPCWRAPHSGHTQRACWARACCVFRRFEPAQSAVCSQGAPFPLDSV